MLAEVVDEMYACMHGMSYFHGIGSALSVCVFDASRCVITMDGQLPGVMIPIAILTHFHTIHSYPSSPSQRSRLHSYFIVAKAYTFLDAPDLAQPYLYSPP